MAAPRVAVFFACLCAVSALHSHQQESLEPTRAQLSRPTLITKVLNAIPDMINQVNILPNFLDEEGKVNLTKFSKTTKFDCNEHPHMCKAPFHCDDQDLVASSLQASEAGTKPEPNLQSWCAAPQYDDYVSTCLSGDLVRAGVIQYERSIMGFHGPATDELDGSYCFMEGHCLNTAVTNDTTLEEANEQCDQRYGRSRWSGYFAPDSKDKTMTQSQDASAQPKKMGLNGFDKRSQTTPFLIAACAMGNYHCDVVYCKETYCKDDYFVKKYSHWLDDFGWKTSQEKYMHAEQQKRG